MSCILTFPKCPTLDMSMCIPGSSLDAHRVKSRIDEESMFLVRMENPQGVKVDKIYNLPTKPTDSPAWKFAITAPALLKKEKGLLFTLKEQGIFWTLEKEKASKWVKLHEQIDKEFILASMEVDPSPHKLFCQELLHAEECEKQKSTPQFKKQNPWPYRWHSKWLELLLETNFCEEKVIQSTSNNGKSSINFPMEFKKAKDILTRLKRGAIVSMAHRCPEELTAANKMLTEATKQNPKDKTWKSLLKLCGH